MNQKLRGEAEQIMEYAIGKMQPDAAVVRALEACSLSGRIYLAAVGKAAWRMANAAAAHLETPVADGVVVTKYGHVKGDIPGCAALRAVIPSRTRTVWQAPRQFWT